MEEELVVTLNRRDPRDDPSIGLGFSLLDKPGFPPVIYDIEENSPAAECGKVEAGDVILKINDVDVVKYSIKEVLKCLRLAENPVSLKLKRDPVLKEKILLYLSTSAENMENDLVNLDEMPLTNGNGLVHAARSRKKDLASQPFFTPLQDITSSRKYDNEPVSNAQSSNHNATTTNNNCSSNNNANNSSQPMFEAYVMTGDRLLKLSKNPSLAPKFQRKIDSLKSHQNNRRNACNQNYKIKSTPSSPVESVETYGADVKSSSANTSPITVGASVSTVREGVAVSTEHGSPFLVNMSKSDDHIQYRNKSVSVSSISVQVDDEDLTSSLNTLLDTRSDSNNRLDDKRVLWTYNAPRNVVEGSSSTLASTENGSLHLSNSPPSPTSVSSSVMSSMSSSVDRKRPQMAHSSTNNSVDSSQVEALSNISSPDYHEEVSDLLSTHDIGMEVTDPSDSDSTLLVSEPKIRKLNKCVGPDGHESGLNGQSDKSNHRIVIQVKGIEKDNKSYTFCHTNYVNDNDNSSLPKLRHYNNLNEEDESEVNVDPKKVGYETLSECDDELIALTEAAANLAKSVSPPHSGSSEEESGSDVDSLHSFHYSPKGVDYPSAYRLAKRLYHLDGFKKSDVSRHLSKNNEYNRAVADEYLKYFSFVGEDLDVALRKFLKQFCLTGESQERERVLVHFSKRYLDCNPGSFDSQDAVHTLTCAIMLLNTDLHGQNIRRKMTQNAFIDNLSSLNNGGNFPREILKMLYSRIKEQPLEWAMDDDREENAITNSLSTHGRLEALDGQGEYILPIDNVVFSKANEANGKGETTLIDYKKGYVLRKCCYETNGKKTPVGKRSWKLMFCTLRDLVLYLHKDDQELNRNQPMDTTSHNVIRLHHALATKASDYTKKQFVFRLQTADRAEYLFQTSDNIELQSWVDTINLVCASFSAPALPEPVGSQKKFQRPLLPSAPARLNLKEQLREHEATVGRLENELEEHRKHIPDKSAKNLVIQNYKEKEAYLCYEVKRYKTYVYLLQSKLPQKIDALVPVPLADVDVDEENLLVGTTLEEIDDEITTNQTVSINRYSYRAAIYSSGELSGSIG